MVGAVGQDGLDQERNVLGIVRAVGIEEYGDRSTKAGKRAPDCLAATEGLRTAAGCPAAVRRFSNVG